MRAKKLAKGFLRLSAGGIPFKCLFDYGSPFPINYDLLDSTVVDVANRSGTRIFTAPHLVLEAALGVLAQGIDVVFALAEGHVEHEFSLRRVLEPKLRKFEHR